MSLQSIFMMGIFNSFSSNKYFYFFRISFWRFILFLHLSHISVSSCILQLYVKIHIFEESTTYPSLYRLASHRGRPSAVSPVIDLGAPEALLGEDTASLGLCGQFLNCRSLPVSFPRAFPLLFPLVFISSTASSLRICKPPPVSAYQLPGGQSMPAPHYHPTSGEAHTSLSGSLLKN